MTLPFWLVVLAIVGGCLGVWRLIAIERREVRIDKELSEEWRKMQVDAAFRTTGQKILRASFQKGNFK